MSGKSGYRAIEVSGKHIRRLKHGTPTYSIYHCNTIITVHFYNAVPYLIIVPSVHFHVLVQMRGLEKWPTFALLDLLVVRRPRVVPRVQSVQVFDVEANFVQHDQSLEAAETDRNHCVVRLALPTGDHQLRLGDRCALEHLITVRLTFIHQLRVHQARDLYFGAFEQIETHESRFGA